MNDQTALCLTSEARREHEVFDPETVEFLPDWQECQHGKRLARLRAHWAETAPWRQGPNARYNTAWFERVIHADGTASYEEQGRVVTFEWGRHHRCPKCDGLDTLTTKQEAYADVTTCTVPGCTYESVYMIGD